MSDFLQGWIECCRELANKAFPSGDQASRDQVVAMQVAATLIDKLSNDEADEAARILARFASSRRVVQAADAGELAPNPAAGRFP